MTNQKTNKAREAALDQVREKTLQLDALYSEISKIAVEHGIFVKYQGPTYGSGVYVALEDSEIYGEPIYVGDWISSSQGC